MQLSLPSVRIDRRAVLPNEWTRYLKDKCNELHFDYAALEREHCIVWNRSGKLIGPARVFAKFAATRYQVKCDLDQAELSKNARANLQLTMQAKQQLQLRLKRETPRAVVVVDMQVRTARVCLHVLSLSLSLSLLSLIHI